MTLSNLVKECFGSSFPDINTKSQINYIFNYLKDLKAESILLESDYIDKDFLEDYSKYYVKCFRDYGSRCARIHFFSTEIDHSYIDKAITYGDSEKIERLKTSYLGFMVIKPLPKTFIGKTCLKVYPAFIDDPNRVILTKAYNINLFGISLDVNSIAFQEQDRVLSACATTAIWSSLHALSWKNVRDVPSCGDITVSAINHIKDSTNSFPNNGLTNKQILRALDVENLRHHRIDVKSMSDKDFLRVVRFHLDSDLPVILGGRVFEKDKKNCLRDIGGHAVTVLGYNNSADRRSIYIHDDRIGPFARAAIEALSEHKSGDYLGKGWCLVLQEKDGDSNWKAPHQIIITESLIIPSYKKSRIPEFYVRNTCECILEAYKSYLDVQGFDGSKAADYPGDLTYKIKIENISEIKKRIIELDVFNKKDVLFKSLARFQWVASFRLGDEKVFDILFDATDIPQGDAVSTLIIYESENFNFVRDTLIPYCDKGILEERFNGDNFCGSLLRNLRAEPKNHQSYLNEEYGELRAPKYITEKEAQHHAEDGNNIKVYFGSSGKSINDELDFASLEKLIWAISHEGALIIGQEGDGLGHPSITGMKPARIAGDLIWSEYGKWKINSKSGRYSGDYPDANTLLANALNKFQDVFPGSRDNIEIVTFPYQSILFKLEEPHPIPFSLSIFKKGGKIMSINEVSIDEPLLSPVLSKRVS
ncbi:hypothetical protein GCM10026986_08570 [Nitrincola alkalisediminis]